MFEQFFGLSENPFSLTPDPRFIFASRCHDEALAHLKYWLEHKEGFALITGEVGTGKTTALFRLIDGLERRYEIAFLTNSTLSSVELLEEICRKFGLEVEPGTSKPALLQKLESYLRRQVDRGNGSLLIIDEAQNFDQPLLEEVRLLSNISKPGGPPMLQIALIGQPELDRKLSLPDLRQLKQRIGVHYRIEPLNADETLKYIHHRVGVAGGYPRVLFPPETVTLLHQKTFGLPREINQVGSQSLLGAYVEDSTTVRPEHILGAIKEMGFRSVLEGADLSPALPPMAPLVLEPVVRKVEPEPITPAPTTVMPAATAAVPPAHPTPARVEPPARPAARPEPPATIPTPIKRPAAARPSPAPAAANFSSLPPLSTPRVDTPPNEGRVRLARIGLVVGTVAILGVAGFLLFMPQKPMRDELSDMENEKTMPVAPSTITPSAGTHPADHNLTVEPAQLTPPPVSMESQAPPHVSTETPQSSASAPGPGEAVAAPAPAGGYQLQVASLRDSSVAVRVGTDLSARSGLPLLIVRDRKADGTAWYAIHLGAFQTREEAMAARVEIGARIREFADAIVRAPRGR